MKKKRPMGEFKQSRHEFDLCAKASGIDPVQDEGCRWRSRDAQLAWYFYRSGWVRRRSWDRLRASKTEICKADGGKCGIGGYCGGDCPHTRVVAQTSGGANRGAP